MPIFQCRDELLMGSGTLCASSTCGRPIEGACILTQGLNPQRYHPGHLNCDVYGCKDGMEEYYDVAGQKYCEGHIGSISRRGHGLDPRDLKAEKRKTRLVDLPRAGF